MAYYVCPRCYSKDVYWGSRNKPTTYGVGNQRPYTEWNETQVPLCRQCGEEADKVLDAGDHEKNRKIWSGVKVFFLIWGAGLILFWAYVALAG